MRIFVTFPEEDFGSATLEIHASTSSNVLERLPIALRNIGVKSFYDYIFQNGDKLIIQAKIVDYDKNKLSSTKAINILKSLSTD